MTFSALPAASGGNGRRGSPTEAAYGLARGSNRVAGVERDAPDAADQRMRRTPPSRERVTHRCRLRPPFCSRRRTLRDLGCEENSRKAPRVTLVSIHRVPMDPKSRNCYTHPSQNRCETNKAIINYM
jgi:hypothetical protein